MLTPFRGVRFPGNDSGLIPSVETWALGVTNEPCDMVESRPWRVLHPLNTEESASVLSVLLPRLTISESTILGTWNS